MCFLGHVLGLAFTNKQDFVLESRVSIYIDDDFKMVKGSLYNSFYMKL